jgi:hypothetical protein
MAEVAVRRLGVLLPRAHGLAVVAVEGVALDHLRVQFLAREDVLEGVHHRRRACAGAASDGDDGMFGRHGVRD